ncbi:MAG: hypothetical protein NTX50_25155, partial [Candidatus Sumerlaeota bacterium]|nr:hypothetical protein [Candidatus Sumerlaeota bacterium]
LHKEFQEAYQRSLGSATHKFKEQVTRLISSSPRGKGNRGFDGPNPALEQDDIKTMLDFALDRDLTVEIEFRKPNKTQTREEIVPEKIEGDKLTAYCETRDTYAVYQMSRIVRARLM